MTVRRWLPFLLGLAGLAHETFLTRQDRAGVLAAMVALVGLPAADLADALRRRGEP